MSGCVPGSVGSPALAAGAVCRAVVVEDRSSCVLEERRVKGRKWRPGTRTAEGALGLYGDWTLRWPRCCCLRLEAVSPS